MSSIMTSDQSVTFTLKGFMDELVNILKNQGIGDVEFELYTTPLDVLGVSRTNIRIKKVKQISISESLSRIADKVISDVANKQKIPESEMSGWLNLYNKMIQAIIENFPETVEYVERRQLYNLDADKISPPSQYMENAKTPMGGTAGNARIMRDVDSGGTSTIGTGKT